MSEITNKTGGICPICSNGYATVGTHPTQDASMVNCPQCGEYTISRRAVVNLGNGDDTNRWKVSAWINESKPPLVTSADVELALASTVPSLHHRAERMLRAIAAEFQSGMKFALSKTGHSKRYETRLMSIGWNPSIEEMKFMVTEVLCTEMGLLSLTNDGQYQVSPKGLLYLEGRREFASSTGFCAMWFSPEVKPLWTDVIEPAMRSTGYEPLRIDAKEHNGKIDDEIMASIRASHFVVSDFTGSRGGVYYEAGFAHGLGLPVIFMCRDGDELHFDIRQYNCIFWQSDKLADAQARLKNRILATLGQGPKLER